MKYRKKPVEIDAIQFFGRNQEKIDALVGENKHLELIIGTCMGDKPIMKIKTAEGVMTANLGDWIIKAPDPKGGYRFWPVDPEYFAANYEKVKEV